MHSLVLIDLGNGDLPNLLFEDENLQYALSPPDDMNRQPGGILYGADEGFPGAHNFAEIPEPDSPPRIEKGVFLNASYEKFAPQMGSLGLGPDKATLFVQYLCSVAQQKSTGSMLLGIALADLVFLQAAWKILNWFAQRRLESQYEMAMFCSGCAEREQGDRSTEDLGDELKGGLVQIRSV